MAQANTYSVGQNQVENDNSAYVRMIPGVTKAGGVNGSVAANPNPRRPKVDGEQSGNPSVRWKRLLLPQPETEDRYALFQSVATDQVVLFASCLLPSLASAEWTLSGDTFPIYLALVTLFGFSEGLYRKSMEVSFEAWMPGLIKSVLFALALVFIETRDETPLAAYPATLVSSLGGLSAWRYLRVVLWQRKERESGERSHVLIVGAGPTGRAIAQALRNPIYHTVMCGFVDDHSSASPDVLGSIDDLAWLARAEFVDEVILAMPNQPARTCEATDIAMRNHLDVRTVLDLPLNASLGVGIDRIGGIPVVTLHRERQPRIALLLKRLFDVVGSLVGLAIAAPLMAILAVLIRWDSAGPAIYSAPRTGAKGRLFPCHKFRSMVIGAEKLKDGLRERNQREGPIFKLVDDPRVTRVGRWIRRYSLDELPQLWNVLMGDMSLVGPRPHPADEVSQYELQHFRRLDVKPGLTGLWQVTARKDPSFELNMHLDLTYIENWTLLLDLRILFRTLHVLFVPEGS